MGIDIVGGVFMKNRDNHKEEYVHLYIALRRRKENQDGQELCFRQIIRDEATDLKIIKERINRVVGTWRIHKTINKRCVKTAVKEVQKLLIEDPENCYKLESLYKTQLMKPKAKSERNFLLDVDTHKAEHIAQIHYILESSNYVCNKDYWNVRTPNGYHFVCSKIDTRYFNDLQFVSIQRDGYVFVEKIIVKKESR